MEFNLKRLFLFFFVYFVFSFSANAKVTGEQLINMYGNKSTKSTALIYINGAGDAIMWTSTYLEVRKNMKIMCIPNSLAQDAEGYYQIFKNQYFRNPVQSSKDVVNYTLLLGMLNTYPCN